MEFVEITEGLSIQKEKLAGVQGVFGERGIEKGSLILLNDGTHIECEMKFSQAVDVFSKHCCKLADGFMVVPDAVNAIEVKFNAKTLESYVGIHLQGGMKTKGAYSYEETLRRLRAVSLGFSQE